jgi:hypothetical protein
MSLPSVVRPDAAASFSSLASARLGNRASARLGNRGEL